MQVLVNIYFGNIPLRHSIRSNVIISNIEQLQLAHHHDLQLHHRLHGIL
jgi:hypothetical protein